MLVPVESDYNCTKAYSHHAEIGILALLETATATAISIANSVYQLRL
jgi:hypothetical protein